MGTLYLLQTRTMDFVRVEFNQFEVCLKKRLTQVLAKVEDEVSVILSLLCLSFIIIHHLFHLGTLSETYKTGHIQFTSEWLLTPCTQNPTTYIHLVLYVNKRSMYKYVIAKQQAKIQKFIVFVSWLVLPPLHHGFHLLLFAPWQCKLALLTL